MRENKQIGDWWPRPLVLAAGCGAVGSWTIANLGPETAVVCADRDIVSAENLGVAALDRADAARLLGRRKVEIVAERHRARSGQAQALHGDVRDTMTPGLVAALDAVILSFDNASAFRDASAVLWAAARPGIPILAVTCGGEDDERWLVRTFQVGGLCPVCMQSPAERHAAASSIGASCAAVEASRASAVSAEAAGRAGAALLARVLDGERGIVGCRVQRDGRATTAWTARMPPLPVAGCPIAHRFDDQVRIEELGAGVDDITVGALAERASDLAGDDATFVLGRSAMPLAGFACPKCGRVSTAPPLLMPAAAARARLCDCPDTLRPLGERHSVTARELRSGESRDASLRAFGASPGAGFVAIGERATVELRCQLDWAGLANG